MKIDRSVRPVKPPSLDPEQVAGGLSGGPPSVFTSSTSPPLASRGRQDNGSGGDGAPGWGQCGVAGRGCLDGSPRLTGPAAPTLPNVPCRLQSFLGVMLRPWHAIHQVDNGTEYRLDNARSGHGLKDTATLFLLWPIWMSRTRSVRQPPRFLCCHGGHSGTVQYISPKAPNYWRQIPGSESSGINKSPRKGDLGGGSRAT